MMLSSDRGPLNRSKPPTPIRGALIGGQDCGGELNSCERMLTGGGSLVRRLNFGEAAVAGGDRLLGDFPPAENTLTGGNRP